MLRFINGYNLFFIIFTLIGGGIGYMTKHSIMSLITSAAVAGLLLLAQYMMKHFIFQRVMITIIGIMTLVFFVLRYLKTGAIMPGGIMTILSFILICLNLYTLHNRDKYMV